MNRTEWKNEFVAWLEDFPWQWFCSLTFRPGLTEAQARWRLHRWTDDLRDALGTSDFQWLGVPETGSTKLNFHYHVLVGGLRESSGAAERLDFMERWHRRAGDAQIAEFKPGIGGIEYILKTVEPESSDKFELHLRTAPLVSRNKVEVVGREKFIVHM